MPKLKQFKAFTLVELLVVMAIIGILATLIVGGFRSSQRRSRDAARKSDLKQIANALEMFYSDYQTYPTASGGSIIACPYSPPSSSSSCTFGISSFSDTKTDYMRVVPTDPYGGKYYYVYLSNKKGFQIFAHLENDQDQNCINTDCSSTGLPAGVDCGTGLVCNYAVTSANVSPKDTN